MLRTTLSLWLIGLLALSACGESEGGPIKPPADGGSEPDDGDDGDPTPGDDADGGVDRDGGGSEPEPEPPVPPGNPADPKDLVGHAPPRVPTACEKKLSAADVPTLCAGCACGLCAEAASACADKACTAAYACAQRNACAGLDCYCGTGVTQALCLVTPSGACKAEFETAAGGSGFFAVQAALSGTGALAAASTFATCTHSATGACAGECAKPDAPCTFADDSCQDRVCTFDTAGENKREASANELAEPVIERILRGTQEIWREGDKDIPELKVGEVIVLEGTGFGRGVDVDFTKVMIGNSRVLETDLTMYEQELNIATQVHHELPKAHSKWDKDVLSVAPSRIEIRVPLHAKGGALRVQVQKRIGYASSLRRPGEPHLVVNALTERIIDPTFKHTCDVVSELDVPHVSPSVEVAVDNPGLSALVEQGRKIFWSYDYNIGTAHAVRGLDWAKIFKGETNDPIRGGVASPEELFGAYKTVRGEVPDVAMDDVYFDPYPQESPIPGFLVITEQRKRGNTRDTGFVGYRYAESSHPYTGPGEWAGFNCASCHGYRVSYERAPGEQVTKVIPGLPNPRWTMKWTVLGDFKGVVEDEAGPRWEPETKRIDKTTLLYAMPAGTGEHNVVRLNGEGSHTDNDYQFSPIAIPNVTHYMPIRRSLGHTESYVGFEGSYIHSEEPDGALGSMRSADLQALTAYMTTLDQYDDELREVGLYRTLKHQSLLDELVGNVAEGSFVQMGHEAFPALEARIAQGRETYQAACASCHVDGLSSHSNERMIRLDKVGRFFAPTIYQKHVQSIRVNYLRDLYWVQHRGLLSDGHVRSLQDLIDPARCDPNSKLYESYYTLHEPRDPGPALPDEPLPSPLASKRGDVFRVIKAKSENADDAGAAQNRFVLRHRYFVEVPWDSEHYYWDYQKMRKEYGPWELGSSEPIGMPAAPHPWCASSAAEVQDLLLYLLTL